MLSKQIPYIRKHIEINYPTRVSDVFARIGRLRAHSLMFFFVLPFLTALLID
jgi:hypothetical protein